MRLFSFLILLVIAISGKAQSIDLMVNSIPNPRVTNGSWIYQEVDVLKERAADINSLIDSMNKADGTEIAVVVMASIGDNVIEEFANKLFNTYKIGQKGKDNGVLILHVLDSRQIRIEVGYGLEPVLTDGRCKSIISEVMVPYFKEKNFPDGHFWAVRALQVYIGGKTIQDYSAFATSSRTAHSIEVEEEVEIKKAGLSRFKDPAEERFKMYIAAGIIGFLMLIALIFSIRYFIGHRRKDPFHQYSFVQKKGSFLSWIIAPLLASWCVYEMFTNEESSTIAVITGIGAFIAKTIFPWFVSPGKSNLQRLRTTPRICAKCSSKMKRLPENQEDAHLDEIKQAEEKVNITQYDVWACSCGNIRIDNYETGNHGKKCPECKKPTYVNRYTETLIAATTSNSGKEKAFYECGYCSFTKEEIYTIPKISTSSSSSSGFSSSSSSSFGGGSSGGGGASGSY